MDSFGIRKQLGCKYDEALEAVVDGLKAEGFGVLTEIDVQATLKAKLDVDFRRYKILGACNPPFAHKALSTELAVGLMMPCNVVVYEEDDGKVMVLAIDPMQTFAARDDAPPALRQLAEDVQAKLGSVLEKLA